MCATAAKEPPLFLGQQPVDRHSDWCWSGLFGVAVPDELGVDGDLPRGVDVYG